MPRAKRSTPPPRTRPRRVRASLGRLRWQGSPSACSNINKRRGNELPDRIAERLKDRGHAIARFAKPRFSIVAPDALKQAIQARCQVVIEALAD